MGYGDIIKRAWTITWRYRALWVLGLFAGVAGSTGGTSGGGGSGRSFDSSDKGFGADSLTRDINPSRWADQLVRILPILIAVAVMLVVIGIVFAILRVAARGGLVFAVNEIELGRGYTLGGAWSAGFSRFWSLLGLSIVLTLPLALIGMGLALLMVVPMLPALLRGDAPTPESFIPLCGASLIGVPLLIVGGVVLGIMHQLGDRYLMLDGVGVFDAAGAAWQTVRTRVKDALIMWFVNLGLNIAAGIVVAIPVIIIAVGLIVPAVFTVREGSYGALIGLSVAAVVLVTVVLMFFTAIWGTFTSALWTVFFRKVTGREALTQTAVPGAPSAPGAPAAPAAPEPPVAPSAPQGAAS